MLQEAGLADPPTHIFVADGQGVLERCLEVLEGGNVYAQALDLVNAVCMIV